MNDRFKNIILIHSLSYYFGNIACGAQIKYVEQLKLIQSNVSLDYTKSQISFLKPR